MRYKTLLIFFIIILGSTVYSKGLTGVYLSVNNNIFSYKYSDLESQKLDEKLSFNNVNIFLSLYKENFFEVNLSLNKENFIDIEAPDKIIKKYGIGFEVGKLISSSIFIKNRKTISPDISTGIFFRLNPIVSGFTEETNKKIIISYGLYFSIKIKINILPKKVKINSLDVGFKYILPIYNSRCS